MIGRKMSDANTFTQCCDVFPPVKIPFIFQVSTITAVNVSCIRDCMNPAQVKKIHHFDVAAKIRNHFSFSNVINCGFLITNAHAVYMESSALPAFGLLVQWKKIRSDMAI